MNLIGGTSLSSTDHSPSAMNDDDDSSSYDAMMMTTCDARNVADSTTSTYTIAFQEGEDVLWRSQVSHDCCESWTHPKHAFLDSGSNHKSHEFITFYLKVLIILQLNAWRSLAGQYVMQNSLVNVKHCDMHGNDSNCCFCNKVLNISALSGHGAI